MITRFLSLVTVLGLWSALAPHHAIAESDDGLEVLEFPDGSTFTTHGVDPVMDLLPVMVTAGSDDVACVDVLASHFEVILARPAQFPAPSEQRLEAVRTAVYRASAYLAEEGRKHVSGSQLALPVLCDEAMAGVAVVPVMLPTSADADSASSIIGDLRRLGYRDRRAKYLIFYDDCISLGDDRPCFSGGQATYVADDRPGSKNKNNHGPSYAIDYGGGTDPDPNWQVLLHEAGHTMGAVQHSAPNASGAAHCNDGQDIMCYADGGPTSQYDPYVCLIGAFDCNGDDYFNLAPAPGSYLDSHWNLGAPANRYLVCLRPICWPE